MTKNLTAVFVACLAAMLMVAAMAVDVVRPVTSISFDGGKTRVSGDVTVELVPATLSTDGRSSLIPVVTYDNANPTHPRVRIDYQLRAVAVTPVAAPAAPPTLSPQ